MPKRLPLFLLCVCLVPGSGSAAQSSAATNFHKKIRPVLQTYCFDCHGDGASKGKVAFDAFQSDKELLANVELWSRALKMLRAGLMPPAKKPKPADTQREQVAQWIKRDVFGLNPKDPDPGRITVRRLNRVEYRNTIRDLLGVDFDTESEFPPDDTGYGFDNIADVLTLPPMLLEKYLAAANKIIARAVPAGPKESAPGENYDRFFPKPVPEEAAARRAYAQDILNRFATRAFRRPVESDTLERLVKLAETVYSEGKPFESGVSQAMVAVLASPRFLFREEAPDPTAAKQAYPLIDEYALASRLSYFLWSSMPDDELFRLAAERALRKNLKAQVARMLADRRSKALIRNFTGQWLRARDIETIPIESRFVLAREENFDPAADRHRKRFRELRDKHEESLTAAEREELEKLRAAFRERQSRPPRVELTHELRVAMRQETEHVFAYVLKEDRNLLELLDSNYTFLNEKLAKHYGITNVSGNEMRLVTLPPDSPRGGVITEGTVLVATSNPTRTSPVKRGVFLLDSILGTPVPPPPPDIPPLDDATKGVTNHPPTLRETLAVHRENALCSSCHNRMDPLGLAFENFNALGMWRDSEFKEPIDATGQLITGESFSNPRELKQILINNHAQDFYRTLTEKLLVYALGRGLEYYDVETVDQIVAAVEKAGGRPSALLTGIIESAPFQKTRRPSTLTASVSSHDALRKGQQP